MGRAVGKLAGSRKGRFLRASHLRSLMLAIGFSMLALTGAGMRTMQLLEQTRTLLELQALLPKIVGQMGQIQMWLEVEEASPDLPTAALAPLVANAAIAAQEMEKYHERAVRVTWRANSNRGASFPVVEDLEMPVHRIDMMVRSFLRGVARISEAQGPQRVGARRDMQALAEKDLAVTLAAADVNVSWEIETLRTEARVTAVLGLLGAALGALMAIILHIRGPRRVNAVLEARVDDAMARVEEVEVFLRGAERDRARMLGLSASGLELPVERVRAAAGLLARTPLTETQGRVLHGLRQALGEIAGRVEGLRVLASQGDGRLRLTLRSIQPGGVYAEWLHLAQARAHAEGKQVVAEPELDRRIEVRGDEVMIRRALDRLLDDALRRSAKGGRVSIVAQLESAGRRWPELRVVVEHDGPPPGPSEIAAIRAPFSSRPPSETTMNRAVDPYALAVVAAICTATGGGLDITARPEGGARAVARLRLAPATEFFEDNPATIGPGSEVQRAEAQAAAPAIGQVGDDPEGWDNDADAPPSARALGGIQRVDGGQDRRRSRRSVPAPNSDLG